MLPHRLSTSTFSRLRYPLHNRFFVQNAGSKTHTNWTRRTVAGATILTVSSAILASTIYADSDVELMTKPTFGSLVRAYSVYSMCSIPSLVDASPKILAAMSSVPGLKQITEAFVRRTFFDQFVGADSAEEALPLLHSLRAEKKGVLFAYSVEVDADEATGASISHSSSDDTSGPHSVSPSSAADSCLPYQLIVDETLHCIDIAANFEADLEAKSAHNAEPHGRRTWVAVKMTALLPDAHALIVLSSHITASRKSLPKSSKEAIVPFPGSARIEDLDVILHNSTEHSEAHSSLTTADINQLKRLYADLSKICAHAKEKQVKIIVDAEYSWYQPAIDALTLALMRDFNSRGASQGCQKVQPIVYGTFQCYLRRTPEQLALAIEDSRKHNYSLGVKLVRGAYHPHELAAHKAAIDFDNSHHAIDAPRPSLSISPDAEPPVWREKRDTDYVYNQCVKMLMAVIKQDLDASSGNNSKAPVRAPKSAERQGWLSWIIGGSTPEVSETATEPLLPSTTPYTPGIGVLFGTHNWESCRLILKELVRNGLAVEDDIVEGGIKVDHETVDRVAIGQLYGMCDDLTDWVVSKISSSTPFVIKYVPYGALAEVMPYLSRRAIENKSVLGDGAAQHERQRAAKEIKKRIFG